MATNFNGVDMSFDSTALNVIDVSLQRGEVPRVDATHSGSSFKEYLAGIPEADSVTVTSYVSPGTPGTSGTFSSDAAISPSGTFRIESNTKSGSIDNAITYTSTFVRTA